MSAERCEWMSCPGDGAGTARPEIRFDIERQDSAFPLLLCARCAAECARQLILRWEASSPLICLTVTKAVRS